MGITALANALLFAAVGVLLFGVVLMVVARALPANAWMQALKGESTGASIVIAAIVLGVAWIIASAVH